MVVFSWQLMKWINSTNVIQIGVCSQMYVQSQALHVLVSAFFFFFFFSARIYLSSSQTLKVSL